MKELGTLGSIKL